MIRTDIRKEAVRPGDIAEKIELMGWHRLRPREMVRCEKFIMQVLRYLGPEKKKLVAAIHRVRPPRGRRLYAGKMYIIERHRRRLRRKRRRLGALLTRMTPEEVDRWLDRYHRRHPTQPAAVRQNAT